MKPLAQLSEDEIQTLFRARCRVQCPAVRIVHIPNETHVPGMAGRMRLQRLGISRGFPDVQCFWPGEGKAAIEFKSAKGRLSEAQSEWLDWLADNGSPVTVSRDPDHALRFLKECGAPFLGSITL
jgi:hypothetical protein